MMWKLTKANGVASYGKGTKGMQEFGSVKERTSKLPVAGRAIILCVREDRVGAEIG